MKKLCLSLTNSHKVYYAKDGILIFTRGHITFGLSLTNGNAGKLRDGNAAA